MITVYNVDGTKTEHPGQELSLAWMQAQVGGHIQIVFAPKGVQLVVHEEGKILGLPKNEEATKWYHDHVNVIDYIVGPMILVTPPDEIK